MKLLIKQTGTTFSVPEKEPLRIGNSDECQLQVNHPQIWGCHARIENRSFGCVLNVESSPFSVNGVDIKERCLIYPGDVLSLADIRLLLADDEYVPVAVKLNNSQKNNILANDNPDNDDLDITDQSGQMSSVFGLRYLNGTDSGTFIMRNFKHDSGWTVRRHESDLIFTANNADVLINGQSVDAAVLQNGDRISRGKERLLVDSPGHSGFSKFSPSHPRNVQLSESLRGSDESKAKSSWLNRLKPQLWWITLLSGLTVIAAIILMTRP